MPARACSYPHAKGLMGRALALLFFSTRRPHAPGHAALADRRGL